MEKDLNELTNSVLDEIEYYKSNEQTNLHAYDIAEKIITIRKISEEQYESILKKTPSELLAKIIAEFPDFIQEQSADFLSTKKLANIASNMDTNSAAILIQNIDNTIAEEVLSKFNDEDRVELENIISYGNDEAGSFMKTELFSAHLSESVGASIDRLKKLKEEKNIDDIFQVHVVDADEKYICSISLEQLIVINHDLIYKDIVKENFLTYSVNDNENISKVVEIVKNYKLTAIPVVNYKNVLVGRITADDMLNVIQDTATEQIYNLAGVNNIVEEEENIFEVGKNRALWLGINLITAVLASFVIGMFDSTIQTLVALAVLMPIVASMGGNAGTQTLTVTVRQMALGEISKDDAKRTIQKEVIISLANGVIFALIIGLVSYLWFNIPLLGVVIAISMVVNLFFAGLFGAMIPIFLQKLKIDPAIGSTVILTTVTDVVGFFSFLGLATMILI